MRADAVPESASPESVGTRWYEARKYDLTVAALPCARYRHAVEPACGPGVLTSRLAARADRVSASDRSAAAVAATSARCGALENVHVEVADVRDGPPPVTYDLVVISECLYDFPLATVVDVIRRWHAACEAGGHVVLVHGRRPVAEHSFTGDEIHAIARDVLGDPAVRLVDPDVLLDLFSR